MAADELIILGIDPGSQKMGWGVIRVRGARLSAEGFGVARFPVDQVVSARLGKIYQTVADLAARFVPQESAVEDVYGGRNIQSALKLGQARGAAIAALCQAGLPPSEYTPPTVKKALVGSGRAEKEQVALMVRHILQITQAIPEDAADALAVAICHAHSRLLPQAVTTAPRAKSWEALLAARSRP